MDRLVSNVEDAVVEFVPLVVAELRLDKASLAAAQSVARVATSALERDSVLNTATSTDTATRDTAMVPLLTDTDTTRDGEYNITKCPPELSSGKESNNKLSPMFTSVSNAYFVK